MPISEEPCLSLFRGEALSLLLDEMKWTELLSILYLVLHTGSHMGEGEKKV